MLECVLVMDFGGQYCHLIARRIRELGVYSEIISPTAKLGDYGDKYEIKGFILSGGPQSVYEKDSQKLTDGFMKHIKDKNIPVLGICYGHQAIAFYEGGEVGSIGMKEYGITDMVVDKPVSILKGLSRKEKVWMSHSDTVTGMPSGYEILAHTRNSPVVAFRHRGKQVYGVQFHPEVAHTVKGVRVFRNFLFDVCECKGNWEMADFIKESIEKINASIGEKKAIIALSGGVDSSTAAVLAHKAIGKKLTSVFIDTGLMRKNEPESIKKTFTQDFHFNFRFVDARDRFFKALEGVVDPEEKRKVIGETFIRVFEEVAEGVGADYLIQGTIYPDRIESGTDDAATIKSHHNVGGLPEVLGLEIIEPLKDLYKDEVRVVARKLGLPEEIAERHPFPGPGLAIRIIGEVTPESVAIVKEADAIVKEEIKKAGLDESLWQFFAVLLSIKSVGVQGDVRTYQNSVALRIVESVDGMTANFAEIPYSVLEKISTRITNKIPEVNRVVYDLTHKPPGTIEWE
ncbi:MAG: GMP synthase (glutamine-hydrolyzing) [Candidatus Altiarchaeales archaeon ex4484_2]|nr:MAG: GMP synthase (glutamine-hydrolyzing) [Candidatus Altiarchaeales archaeon ex4484_2]